MKLIATFFLWLAVSTAGKLAFPIWNDWTVKMSKSDHGMVSNLLARSLSCWLALSLSLSHSLDPMMSDQQQVMKALGLGGGINFVGPVVL